MAPPRFTSLTPPDGVPGHVDPADELSVPVLVPDPAMSRAKTPTDPPRMTAQDFVRQSTLDRKRLERAHELLAAKVDQVGERVGELQTTCGRFDERLGAVESNLGEFASVAEFREHVTKRLTALGGEDGTNGKIGTLRDRVDRTDARRWQLVMWALGLLATAGGIVFWAATTVATLRSEVSHLRADLERDRAARRINTPADAPGRDQP